MVTELAVHLDGQLCGVVTQSAGGDVTFRYDEPWRRSPSPTPLSLSMPLAAATHRKRVVLPFLRGLLTDNAEALEATARRFGVSRANPVALLERVGADVAGSVQITGPGSSPEDATGSRDLVTPVSDAAVGTMLRHAVSEYAEGVPWSDAVGRFSLAGAQPKIALHRLDDGWGTPREATPTTHILKPVAGAARRIDVVEQLTMRAAHHLGNDVAESELVEIDGLDVYVTRRYDRELVEGTWRRLHQEDLCQALAVSPDKKYQHRDGGPGLAAVAGLARSLPREADRRELAATFYRAVVFNVVAGCTDAHAKNYSVLLDGDHVSLAPLYDLVTYAPYWDRASRIDSAMHVGGEYSLARIGAGDLVDAGRSFGLGREEATEVVEGVRRGLVAAFEQAVDGLREDVRLSSGIVDDVMAGVRALPLVHG